MEIVNLQDFETAAKGKMLPQHFDYYAGGAEDEISMRANESSFSLIKLHQRVLCNIKSVDTTAEILFPGTGPSGRRDSHGESRR